MTVSVYHAAAAVLAKGETPVMAFNPQAKNFQVVPMDELVEQKAQYNPHSVFVLPLENPVRQYSEAHIAVGALLIASPTAQVVFMMPKGWEQDSRVCALYSQGQREGYFASRIHKVEAQGSDTLGAATSFANAVTAARHAHSPESLVKAAKLAYKPA